MEGGRGYAPYCHSTGSDGEREGEQATEEEGEREEKAGLASPPPKRTGRPAALPRMRAKDTVTTRNREGRKVTHSPSFLIHQITF
jgi:hypothetical protein